MWPEKFRREWGFQPDLCDFGAMLYQLNYQASWDQVVMWVDYVPIDDVYRSVYMM